MSRHVTRREFLQHAVLITGAAGLVGSSTGVGHAGQGAEPKLGAQLIGRLEGPELVLDPAQWPKRFAEAPMLGDLVKAGTLPSVEKRVPSEPMVLKPLHAIGKYGGTWRRGFTGPGDGENGNRLNATDKVLFWDYTGTKIRPCVAREWQVGDDGKTITIFLRKGMRWSDGHPLTADDFMFWYEDIYLNKDIVSTPHPDFMVNDRPGVMKKGDDHTVIFEFPEPNYLFVDILAGSTAMGGGQTREQHLGRTMGAYMPAHYLKQFHPKYVSKDELARKAKAAGFDGWLGYLKNRWDWRLNVELPILAPWKTVTPINTPTWVLERNPYYYAVDTQGNQLPYIDRIAMTLAENLEVLNLRAIAGQYDLQERHTALAKLPVFLENRARGNYEVRLDPAANGSDAALHTNQTYEGDPEVAKWLHTRDFRRALSLGIDRDQVNETFWLGVGTSGSVAPDPEMSESPGAEWKQKWSTHNPKVANELLDRVGLGNRDAEGYRLRTDGKGRLRIELLTPAGAFMPYVQIAEMIKDQWRKIGIQGDVKEVERSLFFTKTNNSEHQIALWENGGSESLYLHPRHALPVDPASALMGLPIARWFASGGKQGKAPEDPQLAKALELFRSAPAQKLSERIKSAQDIWRIMVDEQFVIGIVGQSPAAMGVRLVSKRMGNVPARQVNAQHTRTPSSSHPATFYFRS